MKILVITHEFPPVGGGGGHVARDICQGLQGKGHQVRVVTAGILGKGYDDPFQFRVTRVPTWRRDPARASLWAMVTFVFSAFLHCVFSLRRWRPDVIHVHFAVPSGPIAWLLSKLTAIPYVITAHLGDVPGGTPKKTETWFRVVYPFTHPVWNGAAKVVAVSQYTKKLALKHYQVPIEVIHNGVDLQMYEQRDEFVHDPPRIVFAGRFVPQKNPSGILQVMAELDHLSWDFVMMGDGPLWEEIQQELIKRDLEKRFQLTGWVSPEKVREIFCESDILFMPSFSEGLPVVGIQALAAGLAFMVSDIGGFVDLVSNGENGFRVPLEENYVSEFVERFSSLLASPDGIHKLKAASRIKAKEFDIGYIARQYIRCFEGVVEE